MNIKTFLFMAFSGLTLLGVSFWQEDVVDQVKEPGEYFIRVSLPLILGFFPTAIAVGSLYMSIFFNLIVKDEQSREVILKKVGFIIIRK